MIFEQIKIPANVKSKAFGIAKLLISLGIIAFLLFEFNAKETLASMENVNYFYFSFAVVLLIPNILFQFLKWKLILSDVIGEKDSRKIWRSLMLGLGAGMITPWRSGEYIGRALPFENRNAAHIVFSTFLDKGTTLFLVSFFGGIFSLYFVHAVYNVNSVITIPLLILLVSLSFTFYFIITSPNIEKKKLILTFIPSRYKTKIENKLNFLDNLSHSTSTLLILFSAAQLFIVFTQFALLIFAFGGSGYLPEIYLASLLVFFSKSFFPPVTIADIGIREAAAVFFFGQFGVAEPAAFSAAIFLFLINLLIPSLYSLSIPLKKK